MTTHVSWLGITIILAVVVGIAVLVIGLITFLVNKFRGSSSVGIILGIGFLFLLAFAGMCVLWLRFSYQQVGHFEQVVASSARNVEQIARRRNATIRIPLEEQAKKISEPKEESEEDTTEEKRAAPSRPDWVDDPPKRVGNVYSRVVSSGPYKSTEECHQELEPMLMQAVEERLNKLTESNPRFFPPPERLGIYLSYVRNEICRDEFIEETEASFGGMKEIHVLMEFRAAQDNYLREKWQAYVRENRLTGVGVTTGLILAGLGLVYGLLKLDTWTRGYYTKRLLFGGVVVIIGLITFASN